LFYGGTEGANHPLGATLAVSLANNQRAHSPCSQAAGEDEIALMEIAKNLSELSDLGPFGHMPEVPKRGDEID